MKYRSEYVVKKNASAWQLWLVLSLVLLSACAGLPANTGSAAQASTPTSMPVIATTTTGHAAIPVTAATATTPPAASPTAIQQTAAATSTEATATQGAQAPAAQSLPACTSPAGLTPAVTEGPYFKSGSPERSNLTDGISGTKLTLIGFVLTADCKPVANAKLDFWQANAQGQYDNSGYTLRGHLFTDASGHYQLETIVPGLYPGRTEHIHVKLQAPGGPVLTTQLFFPGVSQNQSDGIYDQRLLMNIQQQANGSMSATFNFVIATH